MKQNEDFPALLRWWRKRRGLSQLQLALKAEVSQRHVSFLELGRTQPSREMVLRLASALDVPLRQHNALLLAAGYAPVWQERDLGSSELAGIRAALDHMLSQQEPFPAVVVDRHWDLLQANNGAARLMEFLVGPLEPDTPVNLGDALAAPDVLRPHLVNWDEVVRYFVRSVEADAAIDATSETSALFERLVNYANVREALSGPIADAPSGPVLPMHFRKDGISLRLFTTIATLGTPQDIMLQETRVECFFPLDDATAATFRTWAAPVT